MLYISFLRKDKRSSDDNNFSTDFYASRRSLFIGWRKTCRMPRVVLRWSVVEDEIIPRDFHRFHNIERCRAGCVWLWFCACSARCGKLDRPSLSWPSSCWENGGMWRRISSIAKCTRSGPTRTCHSWLLFSWSLISWDSSQSSYCQVRQFSLFCKC